MRRVVRLSSRTPSSCSSAASERTTDGGEVSSDGGLLLLRKLERRLGLIDAVARVLADPRDPQRVQHSLADMLRQRVFGLVQGYEDLNDHATLRTDVLMQTACERDTALASAPTLCRLENRASRAAAWEIHAVMVDKFIASFKAPPEELVLDFDATDDPLHGAQEGRFFHGYYDHYCYLPLYVFCGEQLLVAYLRPRRSTRPSTLGRCSSCWSGACAKRGRRCASCCAATPVSVAGACSRGASATPCTTSWASRRTSA